LALGSFGRKIFMKSATFLSLLAQDVKVIISSVETEFVSLDQDTLNYKETQDRWSILECFAHLNLYHRFYNNEFRKVLSKANRSEQNDDVTSNWIGRKFVRMMDPENIKKSKTLKHMDPSRSRLQHSVLAEFLVHQTELLDILTSAETTDLNRLKIPVEFFRLLHMRFGDALKFVIVHEQRHLLQARAVVPKRSAQMPAALQI
jgi:hypothetical protein